MKIGTVVLCGGQSSRMGIPKAFLTINGETFLQIILHQLRAYDECLLSVGNNTDLFPALYPAVLDQYPNCGPMGGLHAALSVCKSDALLAVSCDIPLFRVELASVLCKAMRPDVDVAVPVTPDGRCHPLCAIYRKSVASIFEAYLLAGNYKLQSAFQQLQVVYVPVNKSLASCLKNVNTPEEYHALTEPALPDFV